MSPYQWDAADYAASSSEQQRWARELIAKLSLRGDERLLDIGCGDGKVTAEIAAQLPRGSVVGIDNSDNMLEFANKAFPAALFPNLRFQKEDARALPFAAEFDVVFSNATLHWVLDHTPVLRGIHGSLKRGGQALLQMGGRGNGADVIAAFDALITSDEWRHYFDGFDFPYGFFGPDEYRARLHEAGLHATRVELIPKDMLHADRAALASWIRTAWLPYVQRVPEEKRAAFIAQSADTYLGMRPPDDHGMVHVNMVRLEVEAARL